MVIPFSLTPLIPYVPNLLPPIIKNPELQHRKKIFFFFQCAFLFYRYKKILEMLRLIGEGGIAYLKKKFAFVIQTFFERI
jgi:hypothetical protein